MRRGDRFDRDRDPLSAAMNRAGPGGRPMNGFHDSSFDRDFKPRDPGGPGPALGLRQYGTLR